MTIVIPADPGPLPPVMLPGDTPPANNIPTPGDVIQYAGEGIQATWHDVWGWVSGTAKAAATDIVNLETTVAAAVVNVVESYVGAELQAVAGFINDAIDFTSWAIDGLSTAIDTIGVALETQVRYLDQVVYGLLVDVIGIEGTIIPHIEQALLDLTTATGVFIRLGVSQVESWAIDNIYTPLLSEIWGVGVKAEVDLHDGLTHILDEAKAYADAHAAAIAAAVAAATAAATIATQWIDDCGEPMCQTFGPKTDLGKLFKALKLAAEAAALADLLSLTEPELVQRLTDTIGEFARFVSTIENEFLTGGRTLGATIAGL